MSDNWTLERIVAAQRKIGIAWTNSNAGDVLNTAVVAGLVYDEVMAQAEEGIRKNKVEREWYETEPKLVKAIAERELTSIHRPIYGGGSHDALRDVVERELINEKKAFFESRGVKLEEE